MACRICRRPNHNARSCKKKSRNKLERKNPTKSRNPIPEKSRKLKVGDRAWLSSGHRIESGIIKDIFPGYGDEKHRRMEVSVAKKEFAQTVNLSETNVWPTMEEASAAQARQAKLTKRWTDDLNKQEAAELLAIDHDYRADYFKAVDLMAEGYEHFQAIKKLGQKYEKEAGIILSPDEGEYQNRIGVTIGAIISKQQSLREAQTKAKNLLNELNKKLGPGWKLTYIAIDSKVERAIHDEELEERYGKDLRRRHYRYNPAVEDQELTGIYSDSIFDQDTQMLPNLDYSGIKHTILTTTDWDSVAEKMADPRMKLMVSRAIRKALQNDAQVDRALQNLIDRISDAADEIMIQG